MVAFSCTASQTAAARWARSPSPECAQSPQMLSIPLRIDFSPPAAPALSASSVTRLHPITCKAAGSPAGGNPFASLKGALSAPAPPPTPQSHADSFGEDGAVITGTAEAAEASARTRSGSKGKGKEVDLGGFELKLAAGGSSLKRERGGGEVRGQGKGNAAAGSADGRQKSSNSGGGTNSGSGAVKVYATRRGRGGKTVTVIEGLGRKGVSEEELSGVVKALKTALGSGGTLKEGVVEIQVRSG